MLGTLPAYTAATITTKAELREELDRVREQGYAVAVDELEVGLTAVGRADPQRARRRGRLDERLRARRSGSPTSGVDEVDRRCSIEAADEVSHRLGWGHR